VVSQLLNCSSSFAARFFYGPRGFFLKKEPKLMKKFLLLALASAAFACAQSASYTWEVGAQALPTSATNICSDRAGGAYPPCYNARTLHLSSGEFVNTTAGALTITITDNSTNCSGSVCTLFAASIAANTTYTVSFSGLRANQGVLWQASGSGVVAWLAGN
jgi:hypothetical protein